MLKKIKNLVVQEEGQALTEYGLVIGLIAVGCVVALGAFKDKIVALFNGISFK
ncbi:Flp family type IVb pilin [Bacillus salipaludis]|uniref:Flp family type IVb pilin n=1 Tax=Bacillus salipaludis TaxID=2547811 RepID=A0A4V3ATZ3_9BACI|nr:Flp family type IVb pilin [Bacillus salipaludis]MDQ6600276.1 Flp family type IVb pilin [Bacillus salipaludis]TDK62276.1 Flp family type IVb pilin [Bacillus salipaludis]